MAIVDELNAQERLALEESRRRAEEERTRRLHAARGSAISRGLSGSTFERGSIFDVNRGVDMSLEDQERGIRSNYSSQRTTAEMEELQRTFQAEQDELTRRWQTLEQEKQNAFAAGEDEKARAFEAEQNRIQRESEASAQRAQSRADLLSNALTLGTLAAFRGGGSGGGGGAASVASRVVGGARSIFGGGSPSTPGSSVADYAAIPGGSPTTIPASSSSASGTPPAGGGGSIFSSLIPAAGAYVAGSKALGATNREMATGVGLFAPAYRGFGRAVEKTGISGQQITLGSVGKVAKKIFCFLADTPVEMPGDWTKPIGELKLGDETLGGMVFSIRRALTDTLYNYEGIFVTGSHAVKEDGTWIRVEDSKKAVKVDGVFEVVSIVTSRHRVYSMGITFADEVETDDYEQLSIDESLEALNMQEANHGAA